MVGDHRADKLIDFLDQEPLGSLRSDLDKIAPEELASVFNIGVSLANVQTANLTSEEPAGQNRRAFSGRDPRAAAGESGPLPLLRRGACSGAVPVAAVCDRRERVVHRGVYARPTTSTVIDRRYKRSLSAMASDVGEVLSLFHSAASTGISYRTHRPVAVE